MKVYLLLIVISSLIPGFTANKVKRGEESKYTEEEVAGLQKLRALVQDALYADYMHRDEYLISWLRTRNLDPAGANEMLRLSLKWRQDEKIDGLENEAFSQFEKTYPVIHGAKDKEGRPVTQYPYSTWDIRKAGWELYLNFVQSYESFYPQTAWQSILVNTPSIFEPVLTLTRPGFSQHLASNLHVLGSDRTEWKKYLDMIIDPDQLSPRFGGTQKLNLVQRAIKY